MAFTGVWGGGVDCKVQESCRLIEGDEGLGTPDRIIECLTWPTAEALGCSWNLDVCRHRHLLTQSM